MGKDKFAVNADGSTAALSWGKSGVQLAISAVVPVDDPSGGRGFVPPYIHVGPLAQQLEETGELHVGPRPGQKVDETDVKPEDYRRAWGEYQEAMGEKSDPRQPDEPEPDRYWAYFELDRGTINRLIGLLRKARDQVFGEDV